MRTIVSGLVAVLVMVVGPGQVEKAFAVPMKLTLESYGPAQFEKVSTIIALAGVNVEEPSIDDQFEIAKQAAFLALSSGGWGLQELVDEGNELYYDGQGNPGGLNIQGPPQWTGRICSIKIIVSGNDPDMVNLFGYELNQEALQYGHSYDLIFHTDEWVERFEHDIGETVNNFGVISGGMSGYWGQTAVINWGRFYVEPIPDQSGCIPVPQAVVSWWPADGNATNIVSGNDGTLVNGATFADGKMGQAFSLDGDDDYVDYGTSADFNWGLRDSFTYEFWLQTTENSGMIVSQRAVADGDPSIDIGIGVFKDGGVGNGELVAHVRGDDGIGGGSDAGILLRSATIVNDGNFHHIALVRDTLLYRTSTPERRLKLYVDGLLKVDVLDGLSSGITTDLRAIGSERLWDILDSVPQDERFFRGLVDEFTIYDRALSGPEIQAIYEAGGCKGLPPVCDLGGPYTVECRGAVALNGSASSDPEGDELDFLWTSNCPEASFDDATSPTPILSVGSPPELPGQCEITLTVTDPVGRTDTCSTSVTIQDTTPPLLDCPSDLTLECTDPDGAVVDFSATAVDLCDPEPTVDFDPPSGSTFALGSHEVTCTATDSSGNPSSCIFQVTVEDTTDPTVVCPEDKTVECTSPEGAVVQFTLTASDGCTLIPLAVGSDPSSGSQFEMGTTTVDVFATDPENNSGSCQFDVTVQDTTAPAVVCPGDLTVGCSGPTGTAVFFAATALDFCDLSPQVECDPPSGTEFLPGTHTVTCTATDAFGNVSSCSFNVTVEDVTPPEIACPEDLSVPCTGPEGAIVDFAATAADDCDPAPQVDFDLAPGSMFAVGTYVVTCTASDASGNTAPCSFSVTVYCDGQIPGDCNQDGDLDISDGIWLLGYLFLGDPAELPCGDATLGDPANIHLLDLNGSEDVDLSDVVYLFGFLFIGGDLPAMGTECVPIAGCPAVCDL